MAERITGHTELIGLMAYPIRHSSSPAMHNEAFAQLGLDYAYLAFEVTNETLEDAVKGIRALQLKGSNVSMPNKTVVGQYLDELSPAAKLCGAVNTIVNENGKLTGHITDGIGYMASLKDNGIDVIGKKMTIAGAGGAATAIEIQAALDGVKEMSIFNIKDKFWENAEKTIEKIRANTDCVVNLYDLDDKDKLKEEIADSYLFAQATGVGMKPLEGQSVIPDTSFLRPDLLYDLDDKDKLKEEIADSYLFAQATGVGMKPLEGQSVIPDTSFLRPDLIVTDTVYAPRQTKLLEQAEEAGCKCMNGLGMMLFQGDAAFHLWTGKHMPLEHMKKVLDIQY